LRRCGLRRQLSTPGPTKAQATKKTDRRARFKPAPAKKCKRIASMHDPEKLDASFPNRSCSAKNRALGDARSQCRYAPLEALDLLEGNLALRALRKPSRGLQQASQHTRQILQFIGFGYSRCTLAQFIVLEESSRKVISATALRGEERKRISAKGSLVAIATEGAQQKVLFSTQRLVAPM
jgi:hypothetical protein